MHAQVQQQKPPGARGRALGALWAAHWAAGSLDNGSGRTRAERLSAAKNNKLVTPTMWENASLALQFATSPACPCSTKRSAQGANSAAEWMWRSSSDAFSRHSQVHTLRLDCKISVNLPSNLQRYNGHQDP